MADSDDAIDTELGAACERLAAFTLPIPAGSVIDEASGLSEPDLVLILRQLYRARKSVWVRQMSMEELYDEFGRPAAAERTMSDADLVAAYQRTNGEPGNPEADALLAEIERRNLDL